MIVGFWERLAQRSIDRPRRAIAVMVAVTLLAVPGLFRLKLRTDGHALVPPDDPAIQVDAEAREHFGLRDPVFVVVATDHPAGIYNAATLERVADLTGAVSAIEGIGPVAVMSLATEYRERLDAGTGLSFRAFLDPLPQTPEAFALLRQDLARPSAEILRGTLLAADDRATAVLVGVPGSHPGAGADGADRGDLVRQILEAAHRFESPHDRVLVVGAPVAEVLLGRHILEDLALLLPLALLVMSTVLWLGCRRFWGVVLGLIEVAAGLVWTFGLMGWLGVPVYLTTAILPVLLTTLGLADEIHVYWHYQRLLAVRSPGDLHPAAVRATMRDMTRPVVFATFTTAIGFLSFSPSGVLPVFWLGLFAGLGILFCLVWSLTVIPAALTLLPPEKMTRPAWRHGIPAGWTARLVLPLWRRRGVVLAVLALISVVAAVGLSRLFVYDSWIEGFAPDSPFRKATEEVNQRLYGTHILQAELRFAAPSGGPARSWSREGPLLDPATVDTIGDFEAFARRQPGVGGVLGLHSQLSALARFWEMDRPGRVLPEDAYDMDRLLHRFDLSLGRSRRQEVVDDALERTVVTIFVREGNYRRTARLMRALRDYEAGHLAPRSSLRFAGDLAVSQAMIPAIVRSQVGSVILSLLGELAVLCLLSRSLRWGVVTFLPVSVSVLWVFGFMGFAGIPLGVATSMFCAITLGTGVDFAIHLVEQYRLAHGAAPSDRARAALEEAGPAIVGNTLANALGFGVLALSQVPANALLGLLVAAGLLASCTLTLIGLGPLLARDRN